MSELTQEDVVAWLRRQPHKVFVETFHRAARGRSLLPPEPDYESHLVIAHVWKNSDAAGDWEIEFVGLPENPQEWADDAVITEQGEHCFQTVVSFARRFPCPLCGGETGAT